MNSTLKRPMFYGWGVFQLTLGACMIFLGASDLIDPHNTPSRVLAFFGLSWRAYAFWLMGAGILILTQRDKSHMMALILLAPLLLELPIEVELFIGGRNDTAELIRTSRLFDVGKSLTIFLMCLRYIFNNPLLDYDPMEGNNP